MGKDFEAEDGVSWVRVGPALGNIRIELGPGTIVDIASDKARDLARWLLLIADEQEQAAEGGEGK